jgi:hypothetical protein
MATRKTEKKTNKTTKRKGRASSKRSKAAGPPANALVRLEAQLPSRLREYVKLAERRLDAVERNVGKAGARAQRDAVRLMREASRKIGQLEERGEAGWRRLTARYRKEALQLLHRLERAIEPAGARSQARRKR